ncbi:flagellar hook-associated protein FlgK [Nocardioides pacificus]
MSGSFSSINTALSAMRFQQISMDVASSNVANVNTDGYVRRRVVGETMGAAAQPAMWSRGGEGGTGVRSTGVDRMVDPFLDARSRVEHANQSYLDARATTLARVETGLAEPGEKGVSAAIGDFKKTLGDLANAPGSDASRAQMLAGAATVADAFRLQARNITTEQSDQRQQLLTVRDEVNTLASDLADTNRNILAAKNAGLDANILLDARDQLSMRLSELTGATGTIQSDGTMAVTLNGVDLVKGKDAGQLQISGGVGADGEALASDVSFAIVGPTGSTTAVPGAISGKAGAMQSLLNDTLPDYLADLNAVAASFANAVNAQHALGFDADGAPGGAVFDVGGDPARVAEVLKVHADMSGPGKVAASGIAGTLDSSNAEAMADSINAAGIEDSYQRLVNSFGSQVASVQRLASNQSTLTKQVDNSREQMAGISLDEEMVNMLTAQRAYEAAARVMTTMDSVLDTLINRTGLR